MDGWMDGKDGRVIANCGWTTDGLMERSADMLTTEMA